MQFTGRVTSDAEVRTVKNDRKVTGFTVAVNKRWKDKNGEKHEKTAFIDCAYWINSGVAEYLRKGTVVEITGWVEAHAWANRDGDVKANLRCDVENLRLFGFQNTKNSEKPASKKAGAGKSTGGSEDDLPF